MKDYLAANNVNNADPEAASGLGVVVADARAFGGWASELGLGESCVPCMAVAVGCLHVDRRAAAASGESLGIVAASIAAVRCTGWGEKLAVSDCTVKANVVDRGIPEVPYPFGAVAGPFEADKHKSVAFVRIRDFMAVLDLGILLRVPNLKIVTVVAITIVSLLDSSYSSLGFANNSFSSNLFNKTY